MIVASGRQVGGGVPLTPSDLLLVRQAIREGWDVPQGVRSAVVRDVTALLDDLATSPRMLNATTWAILAMERDNLNHLNVAVARRSKASHSI